MVSEIPSGYYEWKLGIVLPIREKEPPISVIKVDENIRRKKIKQRAQQAAAARPQPTLTPEAQQYFDRAQQASETWGQNKGLVPKRSRPLSGAARTTVEDMYARLFNADLIAQEEKLPKSMQDKLLKYRQVMLKQGLRGEKLEEQVERYRQGLIAEAHKKQNQIKGKQRAKVKAAQTPVEPTPTKPVEPAPTKPVDPTPAAEKPTPAKGKSNGFWSKVKNATKGKKGKIALIAAGAAAVIGGCIALFGGKKDETVDNAQQQPSQQQTSQQQPSQQQQDVADDVAVSTEQNTTQPDDSAAYYLQFGQTLNPVSDQPRKYTVQKGDSFWNIAKNELIEAHKDNKDYKPTDAEILKLAQKIMKDNGYELDDTQYYSNPMLMPGVPIDIAA